jgi:hypothetical protein
MHVPRHAGTLPDGAHPIPMPDTKREAEMLLILLDAGLYPQIRPGHSEENPSDAPDAAVQTGRGDGE